MEPNWKMMIGEFLRKRLIIAIIFIAIPLIVIVAAFVYCDYSATADSLELVQSDISTTTTKQSASLVGYHSVQQKGEVIKVATRENVPLYADPAISVADSVTATSSEHYRITKPHSDIMTILRGSPAYSSVADYFDKLYKAYLSVYDETEFTATPDEICLSILSNTMAEGTPFKIEKKNFSVAGTGYTISCDNNQTTVTHGGTSTVITSGSNVIDSLDHWCLYAKAIASVSNPNNINFGISTVQWTFARNAAFTNWCYQNRLNETKGSMSDMGIYAAEYTFMENRMLTTLNKVALYIEDTGIVGGADCVTDYYETPKASSMWSVSNRTNTFNVQELNQSYTEPYVLAKGKVVYDPNTPEMHIYCSDSVVRVWSNYTRATNAYKLWNLIENGT